MNFQEVADALSLALSYCDDAQHQTQQYADDRERLYRTLSDFKLWGLGCNSHGCRVKKPTGMATNGPCYCPKPKSTDEYAWVIEAGWSQVSEPQYFCGGEILGDGTTLATWLLAPALAIRFSRKQDAERIARIFVDPESWRVAEHAWIDSGG